MPAAEGRLSATGRSGEPRAALQIARLVAAVRTQAPTCDRARRLLYETFVLTADVISEPPDVRRRLRERCEPFPRSLPVITLWNLTLR